MRVFVDTSALLSVLDAADPNHAAARAIWDRLIQAQDRLVTTQYVVVETFALVQARRGLRAVRVLHEDIIPVLLVVSVDNSLHIRTANELLSKGRRKLILVDCPRFEVMRSHQLEQAFAFDQDFVTEGFALLQ